MDRAIGIEPMTARGPSLPRGNARLNRTIRRQRCLAGDDQRLKKNPLPVVVTEAQLFRLKVILRGAAAQV